MVKNMNFCSAVKNVTERKIESIFKNLHITFEKMLIDDADLNYTINIFPSGRLQSLSKVSCTLYFSNIDYSSNLVVGNIYNIGEHEDILPLYEIINDITLRTRVGNFLIYNVGKKKQLIYKSSISCGKDFCELNVKLIQYQIKEFTDCLEYLLLQLIRQ